MYDAKSSLFCHQIIPKFVFRCCINCKIWTISQCEKRIATNENVRVVEKFSLSFLQLIYGLLPFFYQHAIVGLKVVAARVNRNRLYPARAKRFSVQWERRKGNRERIIRNGISHTSVQLSTCSAASEWPLTRSHFTLISARIIALHVLLIYH